MKKSQRASLTIILFVTISVFLTGCKFDVAQVVNGIQSAATIIPTVIKTIKEAFGSGTSPSNTNTTSGANTSTPTTTGTAVTPIPNSITGTTSATQNGQVILYSTSWCGYCKQAKAYFQSKGIAFVEKDIEKDPAAQKEMETKLQAQGMSVGGVPVIDIGGTLIKGFDQSRIEQLLTEKGIKAASGTTVSGLDGESPQQCQIVLYSTSWCGYCKQAKAYFQSRGTLFTEKDIESNPAAKTEMENKLRAQGMSPGGVPVIDLCGKMVIGFNQSEVEQILKEKGVK